MSNCYPPLSVFALSVAVVLVTFCSQRREEKKHEQTDCLYPGIKSAAAMDLPPCPSIASFDQERLAALRTAERIHARLPNWWRALPPCPCDETKIPLSWIGEPAKQEFHPGATRCYRSPPARFEEIRALGLDPRELLPGQQCCYDDEKKLITAGAAAGTPDIHAPIDPSRIAAHEKIDVEPFQKLGWKIYNLYWPPNNANNCQKNKIP